MQQLQLKNNFDKFKKDFKTDTGLKAEDNVALYLQYINARLADYNFQLNTEIYNQLILLPGFINGKYS
jgi:hypothetical protein